MRRCRRSAPAPTPRGLTLRAEPDPPEGLVFTDAGGGLSLLSGAPTRAGVYSFDVVSSDSNGPGGRMTVKLTVAPAPDSAAGRAEKVPAFLKAYDGGACFAARLRPGAAGANSIEAVGADRAAFSRLDAAFKRETGLEPLINAKADRASAVSDRRADQSVGRRPRAAGDRPRIPQMSAPGARSPGGSAASRGDISFSSSSTTTATRWCCRAKWTPTAAALPSRWR